MLCGGLAAEYLLGDFAVMTAELSIQHSWAVFGPGGRYGFLQYQVASGAERPQTVVYLGPISFQLPLSVIEILILLGIVIVALLTLIYFYVRRRSKTVA